MVVRAYCRCNSGHYFAGRYCPIDGWSSPASHELTEAVARVLDTGRELSLMELRKAGVSEETIGRTIVIEFGSPASAFDAVSPEGYVINGQWKPLLELGEPFK